MDKRDPAAPDGPEHSTASDLAQRLDRYRRRIEAEGRPRSVRVVDRAIREAGKEVKRDD